MASGKNTGPWVCSGKSVIALGRKLRLLPQVGWLLWRIMIVCKLSIKKIFDMMYDSSMLNGQGAKIFNPLPPEVVDLVMCGYKQ